MQKSLPLYRPESYSISNSSELTSDGFRTDRSLNPFILMIVSTCLVTLTCVGLFLPYSSSEWIKGSVLTGRSSFLAISPISGIISYPQAMILNRQFDRGALLFSVSSPVLDLQRDGPNGPTAFAGKLLQEKEAEYLANAEYEVYFHKSLQAKIDGAILELSVFNNQIQAALHATKLKQDMVQLYSEAEEKGVVSKMSANTQVLELANSNINLQSLSREKSAIESRILELRAELNTSRSAAKQRAAEKRGAVLEARKLLAEAKSSKNASIRAINKGVILERLIKEGGLVQAGDPVIAIAKSRNSNSAKLEIPRSMLSQFSVGTSLELLAIGKDRDVTWRGKGTVVELVGNASASSDDAYVALINVTSDINYKSTALVTGSEIRARLTTTNKSLFSQLMAEY